MPEPSNAPSGGNGRAGPVTIAELTAGLIWPTLLRATGLAVQPPRLALGVLVALLMWIGARLLDALWALFGAEGVGVELLDGVRRGLALSAEQAVGFRASDAVSAAYDGVFGTALRLLDQHPAGAAAMLVLLAPVWAIGGGAICRMVAVDVAGDWAMTAREGIGFAGPRWRTLSGALLIPLGLMGVLALGLKVSGWVLLSLPVVNVAGGLLYGLMLAASFLLVFLFVGFVLGQGLLAPAVATEGTDAVDAVQRAYAYLLGRPGRALVYLGAAMVQGAVVFVLARWFVRGTIDVTRDLATSWVSGEKAAALLNPTAAGHPIAAALIAWWELLATGLLAGFVVSFYFTSSTLVYLLLRRVNDEQDVREVWMPGLIPGTLAPEVQTPSTALKPAASAAPEI